MHPGAIRQVVRYADTLFWPPLLLLLWYGFTDGRFWIVGVVAVLLSTAASLVLHKASPPGISLVGLLRFLAHFLYRSVEGGVDIAIRAFDPRMPLSIREEWRRMDLDAGAPRLLFTGTLSLLPGTLACRSAEGQVQVHSISEGTGARLDELEERVRAVFAPRHTTGPRS